MDSLNKDLILDIRDLHALYHTGRGDVKAVNGISLHLAKGETLGLVGETGAGKTTTALSIMRLLPERTGRIPSGSITYKGEALLAKSEVEMRKIRGSEISIIFQDPMNALNPIMPVGKQIGEALMLHNTEDLDRIQIEEKVEEVLELVGIPAWRKDEYPHQFSGGMKQRVVIAIALACEPSVLIADEPTTALDVTIQAQVLSMIRDLRDRLGTSLILITHDLGIVAENCDTVAIMYAGQIVEFGSVAEVFDRAKPHHPYTVGLFGAIPDLESRRDRLSPIEGLVPDPLHLPGGCKFAPRCPYCESRCEAAEPPTIDTETGYMRCFRFGQKNGTEVEA
ncbi:MAG: ABC transporter ATP-binding protein [Clostridia bacterium]|nr:ABC transporter ATP-binding protein [Clostridia bacterium]